LTVDKVVLPDAPVVDGLSFRHFRDDEDYRAMLEVNNASKIADGLEFDLHTLESLTYVYSRQSNHDPARDVLIAEVKGDMVAFNRIWWEEEPDGAIWYIHSGFMRPEWRGNGIGKAMLRHVEKRAREMHAGRGHTPASLNTDTFERQNGLRGLLKDEGYKPVRYGYHMERPDLENIPDYPLPDGLEVRAVQPEHYPAIWDAEIEAFRDHWGFTEPEEGDYETWLGHPLFQPQFWQVAWEGDKVAGMVRNFINADYNERSGRKLGYTEDISVRRPWRRRGLARALIARSMQMHKDLGMKQVALSVDTENPNGALQLYESMGYKVTSRETSYRKEL